MTQVIQNTTTKNMAYDNIEQVTNPSLFDVVWTWPVYRLQLYFCKILQKLLMCSNIVIIQEICRIGHLFQKTCHVLQICHVTWALAYCMIDPYGSESWDMCVCVVRVSCDMTCPMIDFMSKSSLSRQTSCFVFLLSQPQQRKEN